MIPQKSSPVWNELVSSAKDYQLSGLATKIMLMRVRQIVKNDSSKIQEAIDAAYDFFVKNNEVVSDDIKKIFG